MKLKIPIEGITAEVKHKCLVIHANAPLLVLTSSNKGRGYARYSWIVNHQVLLSMDHSKLNDLWLKTLEQLHLPKQTLGFVTAVNVKNVAVTSEKYENITVCAVVTAGVKAAVAAGDKAMEDANVHTVNIILLIHGNLSPSCMVSAVMTATEAKAAVFRELDIRSSVSGEVATGTASDAIAIACTGMGKRIIFAGTGSRLGEAIGRAVKEAVKTCLWKQSDVTSGRSVFRRLEERGIRLEELAESAASFYEKRLNKQVAGGLKQALFLSIGEVLMDANVAGLVLAGLRLGEDCKLGLLPEAPLRTLCQGEDGKRETLGMSIANYIAEADVSRLVLELKAEKPMLQGRQNSVTEDVLAGLVAGALYKVCVTV